MNSSSRTSDVLIDSESMTAGRVSPIEADSAVLRPFRTISVMVNAVCNLACPHCDLPRCFNHYSNSLGAPQWSELLDTLITEVDPAVVSVAAMEPLLPHNGQDRTLSVLRAAGNRGVSSGFVTNGIYAGEFFRKHGNGFHADFMDISVDGPPEVDARVRGAGHFDAVSRFLHSGAWRGTVDRVFISCVLTRWNASPDALGRFLAWVREALEEPRLVLLLLYPNEHVDKSMVLADDDFLRVLDLLVEESERFADLFLELFPASLPGLAKLVERGVLPGDGELERDEAGMLWGHVAGNLFARFENLADLELFHLRVSPEGFAIPPESLERPMDLEDNYGHIVAEGWEPVKERILSRWRGRVDQAMPGACLGRKCLQMCRGENNRYPWF